MKQYLAIATLACFAFSGSAIAKENTPCDTTFIYKTKRSECINAFIKEFDNIQTTSNDINPSVVGVFTALFNDPKVDKKQILNQKVKASSKVTFVEALYRASLFDDAKKYADTNNLSAAFQKYKSQNTTFLKDIKPITAASDNDLMIGAYLASGDTQYIKRILENYKTADDEMVKVSLRMALMNSKFGAGLTPEGRDKTMITSICKKYKCEADPQNFMRVTTLASAFWALRSLSEQDKEIKNIFSTFFKNDPRLKKLLATEENAFGNYLTMVIAYAGIKNNANINSSLSIYENLGSGEDAFKAINSK